MTACGSFRLLFENPLPENPSLIESLSSWNHHKPRKPIETSSFAEIFGELYFQEKNKSPVSNSSEPTTLPLAPPPSKTREFDSENVQPREYMPLDKLFGSPKKHLKCDLQSNGSFSKKKPESLQLCTEGLGSESSDDVDDLMDSGDDWRVSGKVNGDIGRRQLMYSGAKRYSKSCCDLRSLEGVREFPPPISSIGKSGKPCVSLKSYREDGRFVLKEIRIPNQELLRASREDGRLKLQFVHPDQGIAEGEEEEEEEEEEEDEEGDGDGEWDEAEEGGKQDENKVIGGENHQ